MIVYFLDTCSYLMYMFFPAPPMYVSYYSWLDITLHYITYICVVISLLLNHGIIIEIKLDEGANRNHRYHFTE